MVREGRLTTLTELSCTDLKVAQELKSLSGRVWGLQRKQSRKRYTVAPGEGIRGFKNPLNHWIGVRKRCRGPETVARRCKGVAQVKKL